MSAKTPATRKHTKKPRIVAARPAGENHRVLTVEGGAPTYRREPCGGCPWRTDQAGSFPAEAFRHSAETAYDMSWHTFACHESGAKKPALCAGFLLRGADHNLSVRLSRSNGTIRDDVTDGGHELFDSYRAMAIKNGVGEAEEVLCPCRD